MNRLTTTLCALGATAAALVGFGGTAHADTLRWSGEVDDEAIVRVQAGRVRTESNARGVSGERADLRGRLADTFATRVRLARTEGRGQVEVVQQPSRDNGYTALVRIRDREAGRGRYTFLLEWDNRDTRDSERWDRGRNGRNDDRYRDNRGRWDRGRDEDRRDRDYYRDRDRDQNRDRRDRDYWRDRDDRR